MRIEIIYRDGRKPLVWEHGNRPGGSYDNTVTYGDGVVVVADAWGHHTVIPLDLIDKIETQPRGGW